MYIYMCVCERVCIKGGFLKWGLPKSPWLSTLSIARAIAEGRDCHFSGDAHQQRGLNGHLPLESGSKR